VLAKNFFESPGLTNASQKAHEAETFGEEEKYRKLSGLNLITASQNAREAETLKNQKSE